MFNNYYIKKVSNEINYIDVGARGGVRTSLPKILWDEISYIAYEPDIKARQTIKNATDKVKCYPYGLAEKKSKRNFYLNKDAYTSSLYPANETLLKEYMPKHNKGRELKSLLEVDCETLDSTLSETPHLIKIDTQGAELEILKSAEANLRNFAPLVIAETWTAEVYRGAGPLWEIMHYMDSLGYQVFDISIAAAWGHDSEQKIKSFKQKIIGLDVLFVKKYSALCELRNSSFKDWHQLCGLLEVYGFRDYAWFIANNIKFDGRSEVMKTLEKNDKIDGYFFIKILKKILKRLFPGLIHRPRLHY
jgi:FkbM family methyltransferase